ncbi:4-alpha-glucanotransferase [soil metagenome]
MNSSPVPTLSARASGVLLHLTSLPGPHGNGDLGSEARAFVDSLARAGQRWWQMLPVGPAGYGDSPYSAHSSFAGNPLLVALGPSAGALARTARRAARTVDFDAAAAFREAQLWIGHDAFVSVASRKDRASLAAFIERSAHWLEDFALFSALKRAHGGGEWSRWSEGVRDRKKHALARARREHAGDIAFARFVQWRFDVQWRALRAYCTERGVGLIGDMPIFVAHDSADVWQHRELFTLDPAGQPTSIAGVPPDYFSKTGQRWGNPLYHWKRAAKTGYAWWIERFRATLERFDAVRLDHFIGFVRYWRVPADEETAMNGTWVKGPGEPLFRAVRAALGGGDLPLIAEDLGAVTKKVTKLRRDLGLPGMRIVQFAFGDDPQASLFKPYNHERSSVVYTGTHDNDTIVGWFADAGDGVASARSAAETDAERRAALAYLGANPPEIHWAMIRLALSSVANTAIVPMQDVLGLGSEARMNTPGKASGNWRWRLAPGAFTPELEARLLEATLTYGRAPADPQEKKR